MLYRGFTTLSTTLGHLVIALHDGLLHAISNEAVIAPLVNVLKALQTLMASAAYSRLPTNLLPRCIEVSLKPYLLSSTEFRCCVHSIGTRRAAQMH